MLTSIQKTFEWGLAGYVGHGYQAEGSLGRECSIADAWK